MDPHTEQQIVPLDPTDQVTKATYRSSHYDRHIVDTTVAQFIEKDIVRGGIDEEEDNVRVVIGYHSYEFLIVCFISFYALCWLILRMNSREFSDEDHEEL